MGLMTKTILMVAVSMGLHACDSELAVSDGKLAGNAGPQVESIDQPTASVGDRIIVNGKGFNSQMEVKIGETTLAFQAESVDSGWFEIPTSLPDGLHKLEFYEDDEKIYERTLWIGDQSGLPMMTVAPSKICDDTIFKDRLGKVVRGERVCSMPATCQADGETECVTNAEFPSVEKSGLEAKIFEGMSVAAVAGLADAGTACGDGVSEPCLVDGNDYKAVAAASIHANQIRAGVTIGGVLGTVAGAPADCAAEGQSDCLTTSDFPALDRAHALQPGKMLSSLTILGVSGTLGACASDAATGCLTSAAFPAVDKALKLSAAQLAKIRTGVTIAGENGTLADCSSDGASGCFIQGPAYRAAAQAGAATKILSGQSLGGIAGTAPLRPSDCAADAGLACVATASFPAVDKANKLSAANAAKIRTSLSLAGVAGTLADCSSDGQAGCFVAAAPYAALLKTGAEAKIVSGYTLGGLAGTAAGRPSDCTADGASDCVAVAGFPAGSTSGAAAKILDGETVAGVLGTAPLRPADCAADGASDCVTLGTFPAVDSNGLAAKILMGQTLAAISGTAPVKPQDCANDGETDCVTVANFPAIDKVNQLSGAVRAKIHDSLSLVGLTGTMSDCTVDGTSSCLTTSTFPAAEAAGADAKILSGQILAGISGAADLTPAACSSDGASNCVTNANYPAVNLAVNLSAANAAKIRSGFSIAGVNGSLADCSADAQEDCFSVSAYPALKASGADVKIVAGQTLGGVTGIAGARSTDCSSDGETDCVASSSYPAALAAGAAAKIALGDTLAGIPGTANVRPSDCAADAAISCVATANFPAVDKVNNLSGAQLAKMKSDFSAAGVSGTLADCATDGQTGCEVKGAAQVAAAVGGIETKIRDGQSVAGVAGTAPLRPSDCATDGDTDCVTIATFPAIDKANKLSAANMAKIHSSLSIGAVAGTMDDCAADQETSCFTIAAFPAMQTSGAAAKILDSQVLGGVTGTADGRPANCSSDGATSCTAVANFPAIDEAVSLSATNLAKIRSSVTIAGSTGTLADCSSDGAAGCVVVGPTYAAAEVSGAAAKILLGQSVANINGSAPIPPSDCSVDGDTGCVTTPAFPAAEKAGAAAKIQSGQVLAAITGTATVKPANCSSDGAEGCTSTATYPAVDKAAKLTAQTAKIHSSLTIAGVSGTLADCAGDGDTSCNTTAAFPSANGATAAGKILSGNVLAGINGSGQGRPSDCNSDNGTECTAVANYPSVVKADVTSHAAKIRSGVTIAGVNGTLGNCSSDGGLDCVAVTGFAAGDTSTAAPKIQNGQTVAGVSGTALARPANCSNDNQSSCVTVAAYPSVDKSLVTADVLKSGVTILGVTGVYPNSTYKLPGASGTTDLISSNFNSSVIGSGTFEWWDSAGNRYTATGDTDIAAGNIQSGTSIFGVNGTYAPNCTSDNQTACLTTSRFKSVATSTLSAGDIKESKVIGGTTGAMKYYWVNGSKLSSFNRTSGSGASSSTINADIYDSITDPGEGATVPSGYPSIASMTANWTRDSLSDSNSNGICDGVEACVYYDKRAKRMWGNMSSGFVTWENAIAYCENLSYGGYNDWRLPMEKEAYQGYVDGFAYLDGITNVSENTSYHTATTRSGQTQDDVYFNYKQAWGGYTYKPNTDAKATCIRGTD